jgi:tetratricopeptide (TPR) repeat protein
MKQLFIILLGLITFQSLLSQTNKELATQKKEKAVELMDNGNPDESFPRLEEAKKLDPGTFVYDYEIGYAWAIKKDYPKAIDALKLSLKYPDSNDRCYQMLGNMYDYNGETERALKTYDDGLKKYPNSGRLYLEKGNLYWIQKKYNESLPFYEQGIKADPSFPSNYYRAAILFCNSEEEVWGMIFGEIFINLEPDTKRTGEISKLLYETYKSEIRFTSDTSFTVSFSKNNVINLTVNDLKHFDKVKLPYGSLIYEPVMMLSVIGETKIDLASLDRIRDRFITNYYSDEKNMKYPNVLFEFQKRVRDAGFLQAYNFWLLSSGDSDAFNTWKEANSDKWSGFVGWMNKNGLVLDENNRFTRDQY